MHLTNSTSETDAGATGYKMDHEMMYYSVSELIISRYLSEFYYEDKKFVLLKSNVVYLSHGCLTIQRDVSTGIKTGLIPSQNSLL